MVDAVVIGEGSKPGMPRATMRHSLCGTAPGPACSRCGHGRACCVISAACCLLFVCYSSTSRATVCYCASTSCGSPLAPQSNARLVGTTALILPVMGTDCSPPAMCCAGLDFEEHFVRLRPQLLVVTEDDKYGDAKRELCEKVRTCQHAAAVLRRTLSLCVHHQRSQCLALLCWSMLLPMCTSMHATGWCPLRGAAKRPAQQPGRHACVHHQHPCCCARANVTATARRLCWRLVGRSAPRSTWLLHCQLCNQPTGDFDALAISSFWWVGRLWRSCLAVWP